MAFPMGARPLHYAAVSSMVFLQQVLSSKQSE